MTLDSDNEKHAGSAVSDSPEASPSFSRSVERRLVWKTDLILMPCLSLAYLTNTLDRANLGNAKTDTLLTDLHLVGNQFTLLLILFYIPYSLFTVFFTLLSKRFNPSVVIPAIMVVWGTMAMASAATKNFGGLLACRVLMGCVEAAFFPTAIFYCSTFYTRRELSFRTAIFGIMGFIAGAISGVISWSVFQWHKSLHGWQYLFLIEGSMTVGVGFAIAFVLPRSVAKSRWFTAEEKELARVRFEEDSQDEDKQFRWADGVVELKKWATWSFALMGLLYGVGVTSSSNFLPTIVLRIAVTSSKANLYTVGPNLTAAFVMLTTSWTSDRLQQRALPAVAVVLVSLVAWILLATLDLVHSVRVGYFLTYLLTFGTFLPGILVPAWIAANTHTTTGRALRLGLNFFGQNVAGIISSSLFRAQDAPVYKPALVTVACCQGAFVVVCLLTREHYRRLNQKLNSGEVVHVHAGKERPTYRYTV